jgi:hypothetical protein
MPLALAAVGRTRRAWMRSSNAVDDPSDPRPCFYVKTIARTVGKVGRMVVSTLSRFLWSYA